VLIVAGTIDVAPADRDRFLQGRAEAIRQARKETGCIEYSFSADSLDPGRVRIFELWEDKAALAGHLDGMRRAPASTSADVKVLGNEVVQYVIGEFGPLGS
jgi:quinol monooxygenase YgiN